MQVKKFEIVVAVPDYIVIDKNDVSACLKDVFENIAIEIEEIKNA